jgi:glucosamine kinase
VPAAAEGDVHGRDLMQRGADYVRDGIRALGFQTGDALCLSGGVGPHYAPYLPAEVTANLVQPFGSNLEGAFALARQTAEG